MAQLIFLVVIAFSGIGFISSGSSFSTNTPLFGYYRYLFNFFASHPVLMLVMFLVLYVIFILFKLSRPIFKTFQVMLLGFLFSSLFLYSLAFFELNILTVIFNIDPKLLGVVSDDSRIISQLKTLSYPPQIILKNPDSNNTIYAIAIASAGKDNFYGNNILNTFPFVFVLPLKQVDSSFLLVNNTLIILRMNPSDIENVSPYLGYLYVKSLFPGRDIKHYPRVSLMSGSEYEKYRESDFLSRLSEIDNSLNLAMENISSTSASINFIQSKYDNTQASIDKKYKQLETEYLKCLNIKNTDICQTSKQSSYNEISSLKADLENLNAQLISENKLLEDYQLYVSFYWEQKKAGESLINNISLERGAYDQQDLIHLNLSLVDTRNLTDYISTLLHEYLHYTSYISPQNKLSSPFFEEGLTEYYARMAVKDNFSAVSDVGYPFTAKIIEKISKNIPDSDLADIYFSKDDVKLETALNRVYGKNFYKTNRIFFDAMQYTSDPDHLLQLTNLIMKKIGGDPLTEKDLINFRN